MRLSHFGRTPYVLRLSPCSYFRECHHVPMTARFIHERYGCLRNPIGSHQLFCFTRCVVSKFGSLHDAHWVIAVPSNSDSGHGVIWASFYILIRREQNKRILDAITELTALCEGVLESCIWIESFTVIDPEIE